MWESFRLQKRAGPSVDNRKLLLLSVHVGFLLLGISNLSQGSTFPTACGLGNASRVSHLWSFCASVFLALHLILT